jgi:hypothetical protein
MVQVPTVFYDIKLVIQEFMFRHTYGLNSNLHMEHIQEFEVHALMSPTIELHQSSQCVQPIWRLVLQPILNAIIPS